MTPNEAKEWIVSAVYDAESLRLATCCAETISQNNPGLGVGVELEQLRELAKVADPTQGQLDEADTLRESVALSLTLWGNS